MNKTINFFKYSTMALLALGVFTLSACGGDDEEETGGTVSQKTFSETCFTSANSVYHNSTMPKSTTSKPISGINIKSQDGSATIDIDSDTEYNRLYVGVEGIDGYLECIPTAVTRASDFSYQTTVTFGSKAPDNLKMQVKGRTKKGEVTPVYSQTVQTFGADLGTNNIAKVKGKWRYIYEQEDDMGTLYYDYTFSGSVTSGKVADFTLEEYDTEEAWNIQVEGQYKLTGSTLRLYFRRARQKTWDTDWTAWTTEGYGGSLVGYRINWQLQYNTWNDFIEQGEGNEVWECIINDAKTQMQWRMLKPIYEIDPITGETHVSYTYYEDAPIRQLKKI